MNKDISVLVIDKDMSIIETLKRLNETGKKVLFVVEGKRLIGTVTDGDIRRHILKVGKIEGKVEEFYNPHPICIFERDIDIEEVERIFLLQKIELIPVVDENFNLIGYIEWTDIFREQISDFYPKIERDIPVVIMAGGKGTRMKPFTDVLPKPLVPIGEKTVVEHIIDSFKKFGLNRFILILNYKGKMIEAYFNFIDKDYDVEFVYEREFLGTAGGLKLIEDRVEENFIVSNCDIILRCNYKEVLDFHLLNNSIFTSITSIQHFKIPYGVVNTDTGGRITAITEKPEYTFQINTGVYILNKNILNYIPENRYFDIPSLIDALLNDNKNVLSYPIKQSDYIDIGQLEEYKNWVKRLT